MEKIPHNPCRFFRPRPDGLILKGYTDHSVIKQQLSDLYEGCCHISPAGGGSANNYDPLSTGGGVGLPDLLSDDQLEKLINDLLKKIFKDRTITTAPQKLKQYFIEQLTEALGDGYGGVLDDFDFDTPDYNMLDALQQNIVKFSAAKNDTMNRAIGRELIGPDGQLREFKEFKIAAYSIARDHTDAWLKAEYNLAIVSAQAASKWVKIEEDANELPILEFDAVIDGHTTEICRNFNGIRLPINHPLWDLYYIPNHYGERSIIRQDVDNGNITDVSTIIYPEKIPPIFQVNLAKNKMIFPPGHPYYGQ